MLNSLKMGLLGAIQGFTEGRSKQLQEEDEFANKMKYLQTSLDARHELEGAKLDAAREKSALEEQYRQKQNEFKQLITTQQLDYKKQHDSDVMDAKQQQFSLQNENALTRLQLEKERLEKDRNSPANASIAQDAMNFRDANHEVNQIVKDFNKAGDSDKQSMYAQFNIDPNDPDARAQYKAAVAQDIYSNLPSTTQGYMATSGGSSTPFDDMKQAKNTAVSSGTPSSMAQPPPPKPGLIDRIMGNVPPEAPDTYDASSMPLKNSQSAAPASSSAPFSEGQKLKGPDGNTYIVKNGLPVLFTGG